MHIMLEDINDAFGAGVFRQEASPMPQPGRSNWKKGKGAKEAKEDRAAVRSRSPAPRAGGDTTDEGIPEEPQTSGPADTLTKISGPYLEPVHEGGKYTILSIQGKYAYSREMEMSRQEYQSTMAREVTSEADMAAGGPKKKELLRLFLQAIHQHRSSWSRFPELDEYFNMVENKGPVAVEPEDEEMSEE